jgi:hypothetical protein
MGTMFMKTIGKISMSMVFVIIPFIVASLTPGRVDMVNVSSRETATSLVAASGSFNPLTPSSQWTPSSLSSLQPEWQSLAFPILPPPRVGSSLTLNSINKIALLFGGINSTTGELNDLWLTNGHQWMQFQTPHSPQVRSDASFAYDEAHQEAVLYGGIGGNEILGDTWIFNGVDWIQQQPPVSPSPRTAASMVYDPDRNEIVLFGGLKVTDVKYDEALNEMWVWDGNTWQQQFPATLPPARWGANMVYDRAHKSIVLFGGAAGGGYLEGTWLWDGVSWAEQHPLHQPMSRANFGMAYDEVRQQVILFGGQTSTVFDPTDTWAWDGQDWTQLATHQAPPKELAFGAQLVYLPDLQTVVLYNAFREKIIVDDGFKIIERSEVWALTYRNFIYLPLINWLFRKFRAYQTK